MKERERERERERVIVESLPFVLHYITFIYIISKLKHTFTVLKPRHWKTIGK